MAFSFLLVLLVVSPSTAAATAQCNNFVSNAFGHSGFTGITWKVGGASPNPNVVSLWLYVAGSMGTSTQPLTIMVHCVNPPTVDKQPAPWQIWSGTWTGSAIQFPSGVCVSADSADNFLAYTCSTQATSTTNCYKATDGSYSSWSYWKSGGWYVANPTFTCNDPTTTCTSCLQTEIKAELQGCGEDGKAAAKDIVKDALKQAFGSFLDTGAISNAVDVAGASISEATKDEAKTQCAACFDRVLAKLRLSSCSQCPGGSWALYTAALVFDSAVDQASTCNCAVDQALASVSGTSSASGGSCPGGTSSSGASGGSGSSGSSASSSSGASGGSGSSGSSASSSSGASGGSASSGSSTSSNNSTSDGSSSSSSGGASASSGQESVTSESRKMAGGWMVLTLVCCTLVLHISQL